MSGIVGILYLDGRPVDPVDLQKMVDILAHRGPDGADIWYQGSVGLGHRMLWTTPESLSEKLPLVGRSGDLVLTADARIDNRDELIEALGLSDRPAGEITDSDLILASYQKWGEECPARLIGDFAFVIWDEREQKLFCARDHMGVKPFYYYHQPGQIFVFASEIKGLLCLPEVPPKLNETRLADYLIHRFDDQSATFYADILRLPAAYSLVVHGRKTIRTQYWSLQTPSELRMSSDEDYVEAFRDVFHRAVSCRLRSAFPNGSTLSGGLDSSSIACVAREIQREEGSNLHTFSAIFPGLPGAGPRMIDERPYIEAVVKMGDIEPHYVRADLVGPLTELDRVLWHLDEPVFAPNLYIHWALYQAARTQGVRIFLDGENGDTTVSHGYEYLAQLACTGRLVTLYKEAAALAEKYNVKNLKALWTLGIKPLLPERVLEMGRMLLGRRDKTELERSIINLDFAKRMKTVKRIRTFEKRREQVCPCNAREVHRAAIPSPLLFYSLELANRAASAFSVEPRYPFLDRRLIDTCLALPPSKKLYRGWDRMIMRRAMAGLLPADVQWRPFKANLGLNFRRNLLKFEDETSVEVFEHKITMLQQYVNLSEVSETYRQYLSGRNVTERTSEIVYMVGILATWFQKMDMV